MASITTRTPNPPPQNLNCPRCWTSLFYDVTITDDADDSTRRDVYICTSCGKWEYRPTIRRFDKVP